MTDPIEDARSILWSAGLDEIEIDDVMHWIDTIPGDPRELARRIVSAMNAERRE